MLFSLQLKLPLLGRLGQVPILEDEVGVSRLKEIVVWLVFDLAGGYMVLQRPPSGYSITVAPSPILLSYLVKAL